MGFKFTNKAMIMSLLTIFSFGVQSQLVIDDFSTGQALPNINGVGNSISSSVSGGMLGGERDLEVTLTSGNLTQGQVAAGQFSMFAAFSSSGSGTMVWDGDDGMPGSTEIDFTGLGGVDLTQGGSNNGISFTVTENNSNSSVTLSVYSDAVNFSNESISIPSITGQDQTIFVPFSSFNTGGGVGVDFTNVGAIILQASGSEVNLQITSIQADSILTAQLNDSLSLDSDIDMNVSPGDTIRYMATIENPFDSGNATAESIQYTQMLPSGVTLLNGSVSTNQGTVITGNTPGDDSISVQIGNIANGFSVNIFYDVVVDSPLATGITSLTTQGLVSGNPPYSIVTDDPDNGASNVDQTVIPIIQTIINGQVWLDDNGNGMVDAMENGFANVTIDAYWDINGDGNVDGGDALLASASTIDSDGNYSFGLPNRRFFVLDVTDTNNVLNGTVNSTNNDPFSVFLIPGDSRTENFGYQNAGTIGDFIWNDLNGDGVQSAGEPGLSGVTVFLDLNSNGTLDGGEPSEVSDASGAYDFTNLVTGFYDVTIDTATVTSGFILTGGTNPVTVNLAAGEDFNNADFGYQQQDASIGDFIWNDLNGDGVQDGGEPGLAGVTVFLDLNSNGTLDGGESSEVSDASGAYDFTNLATGSYEVTIDEATVTNGFILTGGTNPVTVNLAAGEDFNDADFGYQQQDASIGDFIWSDSDGDGIQDGGEPGLSGVTVYLDLNSNGVLDGGEPSEMTDGSGAYDFTDVATGTYDVRVDESTVPSGSTLTGGTNPAMVNLAAGEDFNDADFGYQPANGSIGDLVWNDRNGNGMQDAGEPGVAGVLVYLDENSNGALDAGEPNATSNGVGAYDITGIAAGTYTVRIDASSIPDGYQQVLVGGNDFFNVTLAAGEDFNDADFVLNSSVEILINDVSLNEGDSGTSAFVFDVNLSEFASFTITVDYEVTAGTATAGSDFTVSSGTLTFNTTFGSGVNTQNITVDVMGDDIFEEDQTFNVVLSNPVDATLSISGPGTGLGTIVNDDAQPEISINDSSVLEGDAGSTATMTFDVSLSGQSELPISVDYVTNEVDATADVDYTTSGGTVNFAVLTTTETINIAVTGDDVDESNETFTVDLSNASNATITDGSGIGTITDDEGEPTVSINDVNVVEGDQSNTQIELTVSLSNETSSIVEVDYQTIAGTAESDVDFVAANGTISIAAKQLTSSIMIDVIGDFDIEDDEQFSVSLTSASNASINDGTGQVTITDDDEGADLSIALSVTPENPQMLDILTYVLTVTNNGPEVALDTNTTLNITDRVDFISAMSDDGTCSHNNGVVSCDLGDLNDDQVVEIVVTAQVTTVGNITAQANASSSTSDDANQSNNTVVFGGQTSAILIPTLDIFGIMALVLSMIIIVKRKRLMN